MFNVIIEKENSQIRLNNNMHDSLRGTIKIKKILLTFQNELLVINLHLSIAKKENDFMGFFSDFIAKCFLDDLMNQLEIDEFIVEFPEYKFNAPFNTDVYIENTNTILLSKELFGVRMIVELGLNYSISGYTVSIRNVGFIPYQFYVANIGNTLSIADPGLSNLLRIWGNNLINNIQKIDASLLENDKKLQLLVSSELIIGEKQLNLLSLFVNNNMTELANRGVTNRDLEKFINVYDGYDKKLPNFMIMGNLFYSKDDSIVKLETIKINLYPERNPLNNSERVLQADEFKNGVYNMKVNSLYPDAIFLETNNPCNTIFSENNEIKYRNIIGVVSFDNLKNNKIEIKSEELQELELSENTVLNLINNKGEAVYFSECLIYY